MCGHLKNLKEDTLKKVLQSIRFVRLKCFKSYKIEKNIC